MENTRGPPKVKNKAPRYVLHLPLPLNRVNAQTNTTFFPPTAPCKSPPNKSSAKPSNDENPASKPRPNASPISKSSMNSKAANAKNSKTMCGATAST